MKTQLYKYDGTPLFEVIVDDTSTQDWSLMSDNKLSVSFELEECVVLTAGCYIDFDSTRFYLLNEYKPTMICSSVWKYDLTLGDAASWLSITLALKTIDGENTPLFKYTAPAAEHAAIIVANLNRRMGTDQWKVGSVISTENIAIDYSGKYCSDVLQEIVDAKNTEWWIDGMTLNIGRAEFGERVSLGYMNGALGDIVCDTAGDMRSYAYLFPIGSTRNIDPTKYGHDRLQLPSGLKSVPINPEQGVAELVEEAAFAHIYPRYEGTVSAVRYAKATNADGTPFLIYYIKDTAIPFNPNEFEIPGLVKHITFQSGELMGQEFEVNYSADSNEFELITRWTGDIQLPGGVLVPAVGDKYVVWNISMPDVYYIIASHELLDAARSYAADAIKDVSVYKVKLDYIDVQERGLNLRPGQRVRLLSDMYFASGYYDSRITRITRNIAYPDALSVDISAVRVVGTLSRLQASIQKTENVVAQFSGQLPAIIKSNDDTSANDSSVYTSAKSEKEFLNKRKGGRVAAPVTFDEVTEFLEGLVAHKYIKVGNGYLKYNDDLGVWEMVGDLFVTGNFAWGSSIDGFKPSTVTDAVRVDGSTIIKKKDSNGDWYLYAPDGSGGGSGGGLTLGDVVSYLSDNDYTTKTDVNSLIASALVGYATQSWVGDNYLSKSGGTVNGDISIPVARATLDNSIPVSGGLDRYGKNYHDALPELKTFIGTIGSSDFGWQHTISVRHRNGYSDGATEGFVLRHSLVNVNDSIHWSHQRGGVWSDDRVLLDSSNYSSYALPLTGGTVNGSITASSFIGNLTGNASQFGGLTENSFTKSQYLNEGDWDRIDASGAYSWGGAIHRVESGVANPPLANVYNWTLFQSGNIERGSQIAQTAYGGGTRIFARSSHKDTNSWHAWREVAFTDSNVDSATKLQTARTIWGQSFDGTGNLTGPLCLYGKFGLSYDVWLDNQTLSGVNFRRNDNTSLLFVSDNVGIGTAYPGEKLEVNGNVKVNGSIMISSALQAGGVNMFVLSGSFANFGSKWYNTIINGATTAFNIGDSTVMQIGADGNTTINGNLLVNGNVSWFSHSQRSLKNIVSEQGLSLAQLERIKPIKFYWKDGRDMVLHVGGVADVFAEVLPEVVARNLQDILCLNYVDAAFYVGASLIAPVLDHERRITKGEAEQEALKKENAKLKRELEEVKSKLNQLVA